MNAHGCRRADARTRAFTHTRMQISRSVESNRNGRVISVERYSERIWDNKQSIRNSQCNSSADSSKLHWECRPPPERILFTVEFLSSISRNSCRTAGFHHGHACMLACLLLTHTHTYFVIYSADRKNPTEADSNETVSIRLWLLETNNVKWEFGVFTKQCE